MAATAIAAPLLESAAPSAAQAAPWRLILAVTVPFWLFMTCERVLMFLLARPSGPLLIIAPPAVRIGQHLLLLPLLLLCYAGALKIGWPQVHRATAATKHLALALLVGVRTYRELKDEKRRATRLESECTHSRLQVRIPFARAAHEAAA